MENSESMTQQNGFEDLKEYIDLLKKHPESVDSLKSIESMVMLFYIHKDSFKNSVNESTGIPDILNEEESAELNFVIFNCYNLLLTTFPLNCDNELNDQIYRLTFAWIKDSNFSPVIILLLEFIFFKHDGEVNHSISEKFTIYYECYLNFVTSYDHKLFVDIIQLTNEDIEIYTKSIVNSLISSICTSKSSQDTILHLKQILEDYKNHRTIADIIIKRLHYFNQVQIVITREEIQDLLIEYSDYLTSSVVADIIIDLEPGKINVLGTTEMYGNFANLTNDKVACTELHFTIPFSLQKYIENSIVCKPDNEITIFFASITNKDDFVSRSNTSISSIPSEYLADVTEHGIKIVFRIPKFIDFYHKDGNLEFLPDERTRNIYGDNYNPYKVYLLNLIHDYIDEISYVVDLRGERITNNSFSNIGVCFRDSNNVIIAHSIIRFTYQDSFQKKLVEFNEKFELLNLNDTNKSVYQILKNAKLETINQFKVAIYESISKILKKMISENGLSNLMLKENGEPKKETDLQPLVYALLAQLETYEIKIHREELQAGGNLDFLFTKPDYKKNTMSIACEMKLAHHDHIDNGIKLQLPAYMKSCNAKYGIFLVLWLKSSAFNKPSKFTNIIDLENHLKSIAPPNIEVIIIDCNPVTSPSKLK